MSLSPEEELDLGDSQWEDVHVITGALKMFFRELPEPLFPFRFFDLFVEAISKYRKHLQCEQIDAVAANIWDWDFEMHYKEWLITFTETSERS